MLLLLPLIGNSSAERSGELSLVQSKLRENRVRYKAQIDLFNSQADEQERRHCKKKHGASSESTTAEDIKNIERESTNDDDELKEDPDVQGIVPLSLKPPFSPSIRTYDKTKGEKQVIHFATTLSAIIPSSSSSSSSSSIIEDMLESENDPNADADADAVGFIDVEKDKESISAVPNGSSSNSSNSSNYSSDTENSSESWSKVKFDIPPNFIIRPLKSGIKEKKIVDPLNNMIITSPSISSISNSEVTETTEMRGLDSVVPIKRTSSLMRPKSMGHIVDKRLATTSLVTVIDKEKERKQRKEKNVLNVFFAAPLAWRDRSNRLHPLEVLDYGAER